MKFYFNEELWGTAASPKWWFRPAHLGAFNNCGLVDNGRIYLWTSSKYIYSLDAKTGKQIWKLALPIGRAAYGILEDVNDDGIKEFIVGTTINLPIRVYCIDTQKPRILWVTNLHGDFIRRGLASCRNRDNRVRIIVATRDAPYSRGTLNVLDKRGRHLYPPIYGVDVCNNIPTIGDINNDGKLEVVIGSHSFYGAKYGDKVSAFDIETGKLLWSTSVGFDTGYIQLSLSGNKIIANGTVINTEDGQIITAKQTIKRDNTKAFLVPGRVPYIEFNLNGKIIKKDIADSAFKVMQEVLPSQQELVDFGNNENYINYKKVGYQEKIKKIIELKKTEVNFELVNIDGERHALVNYNCVLFCFDLSN